MAVRRGGLGKGLSALIPTGLDPGDLTLGDGVAEGTAVLVDLPIGAIEPNPHQPRSSFDEDALLALSASVRELGVLQPVLVRPLGDGRYQLIAGERRWRAAKRAGLDAVPSLVKTSDDQASVEQALVENLHRQDLNALEEAAAYSQLIDEFGLTHDEVATRVGKSRSAVSNTLRLLQLPQSIQKLLAEGRLSAGHARALLGTPDRAYQEALARSAADDGWNVRAVEDAVRTRATLAQSVPSASPLPPTGPDLEPDASARRLPPPALLHLEELLSGYLDTRVTVTMAAKRGRVSIEFADLEDLERIYRRMTEGALEE